jgi:predicted AlkP superfamily phosphohydrolase/phosphomutase
MSKLRVIAVAALVVSVALFVVAVVWSPDQDTRTGPTTQKKVIVLGIDGMDWFLTAEMLRQERMPSLGAMLQRSATGEIAAEPPALPDAGWTRLSRGRDLSEDEIGRLTPTGDGVLYGVTPTLAEIVEAGGGEALVVGWPGTWPAAWGDGSLAAPFAPAALSHETALSPALLAGDSGLSISDELRRRAAEVIGRNESVCEDEFRRTIFDGEPHEEMWREHLLAARWAMISDQVTADLAASLIAEREPDLALVCLSGLDAVGHRFISPAMPDFFAGLPEEQLTYGEVLPNYYTFIDGIIERFRRLMGEDTVLIVCSTYGTHPAADIPGISGAHTEGPPGVLVVRGRNFQRPQRAIALSAYDLAPSILALLGMRIPTDLDGRVLTEIFPRGFAERYPLVYGGKAPTPASCEMPRELEETARVARDERLELLRDGMGR